jgi:ubiquinone/menaquinone biosynthesis C-methylase UbiE
MDPDNNYKTRIKQDTDTAQRYTRRKERKHAGEMRLIATAIDSLPNPMKYLDIPCGAGRATILLGRKGNTCISADIGDGVLEVAKNEIAKAGIESEVLKLDLERIDLPDNSIDASLAFRIFHHFPGAEVRSRVVAELCRVSRRYVLISYLTPWSYTNTKRRLRAALGGKVSRQHATPLSEVKAYFTAQKFRLVNDYAISPFNSLRLAVFEDTGI